MEAFAEVFNSINSVKTNLLNILHMYYSWKDAPSNVFIISDFKNLQAGQVSSDISDKSLTVIFQAKMKAVTITGLLTQYRGGELQQALTPAECHKTSHFVFRFHPSRDALSAPVITYSSQPIISAILQPFIFISGSQTGREREVLCQQVNAVP